MHARHLYEIKTDCWQNKYAECHNQEAWNQALRDKEENPSLPFSRAEWIIKGGVRYAMLSWRDGKWR